MLFTAKLSLKVSLISLILIFSLTEVSQAHHHHSYAHDIRPQADNPNWMSVLPDSVRLSELSLPGTHETMSLFGTDSVKNQTMTLPLQLESGIRVLDIRCAIVEIRNPQKPPGAFFNIYHGVVYQRANFDDVLKAVVDFLEDHRGETVLMRVKMERTRDHDRFADVFRRRYWIDYNAHMWKRNPTKPEPDNPTLGEMRGKIVILQDFARWQCPEARRDDIPANPLPNKPEFGICYSLFATQDSFYLRTNLNLYQKWIYVNNHLAAANSGSPDTKYINYLTASGGVLPYFVVSGHWNPATGAARLWTGFTTVTMPNGWPDFPRIDDRVYFEGTNTLVYEAIRTAKYTKRVGIIMTDFPGGGLIERIICINYPKTDPLCKRLPPCTGPLCAKT